MEYQFCPKCGAKAVKEPERLLVCPNCSYHFYINPAPTNAVILENSQGEILIVKRKFDPFKGFLDLPGGFIEPGESIEESAIREIKEELGVDIKKVTYFNSYPDEYIYLGIKIKTLGMILTGKIEDEVKIIPSDDIDEARFYKKSEIPFDKIAFGSIHQGLIDYISKKS